MSELTGRLNQPTWKDGVHYKEKIILIRLQSMTLWYDPDGGGDFAFYSYVLKSIVIPLKGQSSCHSFLLNWAYESMWRNGRTNATRWRRRLVNGRLHIPWLLPQWWGNSDLWTVGTETDYWPSLRANRYPAPLQQLKIYMTAVCLRGNTGRPASFSEHTAASRHPNHLKRDVYSRDESSDSDLSLQSAGWDIQDDLYHELKEPLV